MSFNRWMYVDGNPVNYTDPTGLITQNEVVAADEIVKELKIYNVFVKVDWHTYGNWDVLTSSMQCGWYGGEWTLWELQELQKGVVDTSRAMGGLNAFIFNYGHIKVEKRLPEDVNQQSTAAATGIAHLLVVNSNFDNAVSNWVIVHELGHVWDGTTNWKLSKNLVTYTKKHGENWGKPACDSDKRLPGCNNAGYVYYAVLAGGADADMNKLEDFANSFVAYVYPVDSQGRIEKYKGTAYDKYLYYADYTTTVRWRYIDGLVQEANARRK